MTTLGLMLIVISAFLTVAANLMMRAGVLNAGGVMLSKPLFRQIIAISSEPLFVGGFIFYGLAALVWFHVLSVENLSTSYPLLVSLTFVFVTLGAMFFFKEHVSWIKMFGIGVCLAGVFIVARS
jgi:multidrug transporter EmrE-like cation transporter